MGVIKRWKQRKEVQNDQIPCFRTNDGFMIIADGNIYFYGNGTKDN